MINSYSYAPSMVQDYERVQIDYYENDDMYMELERVDNVYCVMAYSWDGSLDVSEEFSELSKAAKLYEYIFDNYTSSPPGDELQDFISGLLYEGRYTA